MVRRTFLRLGLTTNFAEIDAGTLGSPAGAVEPTASSGRSREAKLAQRSTFHKGIHARGEKWLSARGNGAKRLRGEPPKLHKYTKFVTPMLKIPSRAGGANQAEKIGSKEKKAKTKK